MTSTDDPIALAQALIRCPSVTPDDAGALGVLGDALAQIGFDCHRLRFADADTPDVENLYARLGAEGRNFCFAGHTDVVPTGDAADWSHDPFSGEIIDGALHGRGAADMKSAVAAFTAATGQLLARHGAPDTWPVPGSISLLITGDEEGPAINGTRKILSWLAERGEQLDACVVGEPTNPDALGDMIKIGRRGSTTGDVTVRGVQGHTAYPHLADNPTHHLVRMLNALTAAPLDQGSEHFQATTLQITTIDVGNPANNVIPGRAHATFNIRFNDLHTSDSLDSWVRQTFDAALGDSGASYELSFRVTGESFITPPGPLSDAISSAIQETTGHTPELSTTGGTSDARFIKDFCPVVEFGLVGQTMHKVDEHVATDDIVKLTAIYLQVLETYFDLTR
ncbi:MAG: succinyl-diaminopimelate desuccinylase [Alphaproteobacteria bacterium]|jgi:succinyl-diaminopimelate desuccinylase|nr:succinyl-diaminopimelate desuccinylase [Alphaproteobacteria bacterium]